MSRSGTLDENGMFMPDYDCPNCGYMTFEYNKNGEYVCNYCSYSNKDKPKKSKSKLAIPQSVFNCIKNSLEEHKERIRKQIENDTTTLEELNTKIFTLKWLEQNQLRLPDKLKFYAASQQTTNLKLDSIEKQVVQLKERILMNQHNQVEIEKQIEELNNLKIIKVKKDV